MGKTDIFAPTTIGGISLNNRIIFQLSIREKEASSNSYGLLNAFFISP